MIIEGRVWKFGDNISTDLIAPGHLFHLRSNLPELAKHVLEGVDPDFAGSVKRGDMIVGGENFGLGSSREHAPTIIKMVGVSAILAKSFARIFYRNAINIGLPVFICDTNEINQHDSLTIDLSKGLVKNRSTQKEISFVPLPKSMITILNDGGLVAHIQKYGDFNF